MSVSRILLAVSSPWASDRFLEPITDLSKRLDAEVVIAHVTQQQDEDENDSDARQRGEQTLKLLTDALSDADVRAEGVMLFANDTAKAILNTAQARNCTLIVLGVNGKGMFKRLIAPDVPSVVIRQSPIPVLVCPANWVGTF